jgi:hypothetical protein
MSLKVTACPSVQVRLPGFLTKEHRRLWLEAIATRGLAPAHDPDYIPLRLQGQTFVFR